MNVGLEGKRLVLWLEKHPVKRLYISDRKINVVKIQTGVIRGQEERVVVNMLIK